MDRFAISHRIMTVITEHYRLTSALMRSDFNLTYSGLSTLTTLLEYTEAVPTPWLCDYLMLERKTVWNVLLKLEDRGLIAKEASPIDGRTMLLSLTPEGRVVSERANEALAAFARERFLASLQDEEFFEFMRDSSRESCDILRGHSMPTLAATPNQSHFFGSSHLLLWRTLISRWKEALRDNHGPSLSAFRLLDLLDQEREAKPSGLADTLRLPRSNASLYFRQLIQGGLIRETPSCSDGRYKTVALTKRGTQETDRLRKIVQSITQEAHRPLSQDGQLVVEAWYARMYVNLLKSDK